MSNERRIGSRHALVLSAVVLAVGLAVSWTVPACFLWSHNVTIAVEHSMLETTPNYARKAEVLLGAELILILFANATTGFQWTNPAEISDPTVMEQTDWEYRIRSNPRDGEPGHEVFTFEARKKGTCTIRLEYKRPFEAEVLYTCTITVEVK